jgi:methionyl-tRNA formyltransferase
MKLIFMGTPQFAVPSLAKLIEGGHQVSAVFTQPDKPSGRGQRVHESPVKALAKRHSIPVYQPEKIRNNEEVRSVFESISPDVCVVAAYGKILPAWMLAIPKLGCINVHASLLPKYRGAAPINWAIANGERVTGVTIMQMDAGMDTGPMLAKSSTEIGPAETAVELSERLSMIGASLLSETLPRVERGEIQPEPQDDSQATKAPMLKREDGLINWRMTAEQIANRVRAFQPWPTSFTSIKGRRLLIWEAKAMGPDAPQPQQSVEPGTLISLDPQGFTIGCGERTQLRLEELQPEGRPRMRAAEFANGARLEPGVRFN